MLGKPAVVLGQSVVVIGSGRFGSSVARSVVALGHEVLVIEDDEEVVQALAGELSPVVRADATGLAALRQLSVTNLAYAVASIGTNLEASLLTVLNLAQLGMTDIWAKANSSPHGCIAERLGAHRLIFPKTDMGERVARLVTGKMMGSSSSTAALRLPKPARRWRRTTRHCPIPSCASATASRRWASSGATRISSTPRPTPR
jgi:trk system potassium uptake protein TrkA